MSGIVNARFCAFFLIIYLLLNLFSQCIDKMKFLDFPA